MHPEPEPEALLFSGPGDSEELLHFARMAFENFN
jgi:hypothetical protein